MLERMKDKEQPTRNYCVGSVELLQDIPSALGGVSAKYCLFLALDATSINDEEIRRTAKMLLERGITYFCVWGPGCERVHDLFDLERLPEEPRDCVVMTTWHSKDSLSKALWFFEYCVEPAEGFAADCRDWVALSIANESWAQHIRTALMEQS
jgi:hypothetical protein